MTIVTQWKPSKKLQDRVNALAQQRGEAPDEIITEAVLQYLEFEVLEYPEIDQDPLVGLFSSSKSLGRQSEEILQQELRERSGWTWKETLL